MLTELAIRRPIMTAMASIVVIVLGVMSFFRLGIDMFPDVSLPFVTVVTVYPGAGPLDVEDDITTPIEDAISGIAGCEGVFSRSAENVSLIWVQFSMESDTDTAVQEVRERVERVVRDLPEGAEQPQVSRFDVRAFPILTYSVSAGDDPERTRNIALDTIKPALEQIPGVALVRVNGGRTREVQVRLDPERLESHGVAAGQVYQRIQQENVSFPSGRFETGPSEVGVRVDARVANADDVGDIIITGGQTEQLIELGETVRALARNGQIGVASMPDQDETPLRVEDVAEVVETFREEREIVRLDGREAVILEVIKQSGANTVEIAEQVREVLARLQNELEQDVVIAPIRDEAAPITENAHDVQRALVIGGIMAVFVILIFLVDWRGTLISALALPVSVIGTFAIMMAFGFTLNILTLLGLALAIGLLIDDSVVVREAITRRLELGDDPFVAAREGTKEIRLAVLATTLTVCAVFVPVAFMSGMVGQFFKEFGLTVAGAVMLSLFVAFTLDPMLSARFAKKFTGEPRKEWVVVRGLKKGLDGLDNGYRVILKIALRHPVITIFIGIASFAGGIALAPILGFEFIPVQDRGRFIVNMRFPASTGLDESSRRSIEFERAATRVEDVVGIQCTVGEDDDARRVRCNVLCTPKTERTRTLQDIKDDIRALLSQVPQATFAISNVPVMEGVGDYPPVVMQIRGPDLDRLREHADRIEDGLNSIEGTSDVEVRYTPGLPELAIEVDRDRARDRGLSAFDIALQTRLALHGEVAGSFRRGRRNLDIRVLLSEEFRRDPDSLGDLMIFGHRGGVRLGDVTTIENRSGPVSISHEGRQRQISVWSQVVDRPLGDIMMDIHATFDDVDWGEGYTLKYAGFQEDMTESNEAMGMALILALIFIYVILASQFESLIHPFTIVLSLPLGFLGAFIALGHQALRTPRPIV